MYRRQPELFDNLPPDASPTHEEPLGFVHPWPLCDGPKPVIEMRHGEVRHVRLHLETDGLIWRYVDFEVHRDSKLWPVVDTDLDDTDLELDRPKTRRLN